MDDARIATQITTAEAQLDQLATAIAALADPTVKFYTLDSGQTMERVERNTLKELIESQSMLMNQLDTLCVRQNGSGSVTSRPAF